MEYFSTEPPPVEISLTHETVALLATGWGAGEAATAIRIALGIEASWREKVAALAGALLGYTAGRWAFKRTVPACDSEQIVQLLNNTPSREVDVYKRQTPICPKTVLKVRSSCIVRSAR